MRRTVGARLRSGLCAVFGTWPLFEVRNKLLHWPGAVRAHGQELLEVRRLRPTVVVPQALVTTIVPTYRRPESLTRAVRSALDQTVHDHVVVVVDDGAGLPPLPDDDRLVAVSLARNTGRAGVVRNVGIALSRSTYLAFLDDDNEWRPHHLATALEALTGAADPVDLVYTGVERVRPDGTTLDVLARPFARRTLRESCFVDTNSIVVRRGRGVRFSRLPRSGPNLPGEDWELVWRLSRRLRVRNVPETTVTYLVNPESYFTRWDAPAAPAAPAARPHAEEVPR
jgi:glycosyltransferase involved in cell wall biosynthesis